jgi:DNA repair protein SbcD/Mre11
MSSQRAVRIRTQEARCFPYMAFRFLHLADLHLASGFGGSAATKARLRSSILESFGDAMSFAIRERLDAVLIAGDLYDEEKLTPRIAARFLDEVERVASQGIDVLWVTGNHDPGAAGQRAHDWLIKDLDRADGARAAWRGRVHVFSGPEPRAVKIGKVGLVVGAGHPHDRESRNLAATFPTLDELAVEPGRAVVGILHTQVEGAPQEHARYAPSTYADFEARPYSYWALGHVHLRQQAVPNQPVWYCGNLMGRSAKPAECGAKGGLLVTAEPGRPATPEFVSFGRHRWERVVLDTHARQEPLLADLHDADYRDGFLAALQAVVLARLPEDAIANKLVLRVELIGPLTMHGWLREADFVDELGQELGARLGVAELDLRAEQAVAVVDRQALLEAPTVLARALELHAEYGQDLEAALGAHDLGLLDLPSEADERAAYLASLWQDLDALAIERLLARNADGGPG